MKIKPTLIQFISISKRRKSGVKSFWHTSLVSLQKSVIARTPTGLVNVLLSDINIRTGYNISNNKFIS
jgi:hypothetical protein